VTLPTPRAAPVAAPPAAAGRAARGRRRGAPPARDATAIGAARGRRRGASVHRAWPSCNHSNALPKQQSRPPPRRAPIFNAAPRADHAPPPSLQLAPALAALDDALQQQWAAVLAGRPRGTDRVQSAVAAAVAALGREAAGGDVEVG